MQANLFQTSSAEVISIYENDRNIKVVDCPEIDSNICAIYFSSNNLYFPNTAAVFNTRIVSKDHYEWFGTRIENAARHIFVRDVKKQWYLEGVSSRLPDFHAVLMELRALCEGFDVITLGSSAGGYAAVLYGVSLRADKIFSFNGQMRLDTLVSNRSSPEVDPLVFHYHDSDAHKVYYSLSKLIDNFEGDIFYFCSKYSDWDAEQRHHVQDKNIFILDFRTKKHGIPFLKTALPRVIQLDRAALQPLADRSWNPVAFAIKVSGILPTVVQLILVAAGMLLGKVK